MIWLAALAALLLGWAGSFWNLGIAREKMRQDVLVVAESAAAAIDVAGLEPPSDTDFDTEPLRRLRRSFHAFAGIGFEGIRLSVSFPDHSGFMVGSADSLPISRAASDWESAEITAAVENGHGRVVGPYVTSGGTFVGAFVPVNDARSGETLLVVAAEADAERWQQEILSGRPSVWPFALVAAVVLAAGGLALRWRDRLPAKEGERWRDLEVALVAVVGLTATMAIAMVVQDHEQRTQETAFLQLSRERAIAIRDAFHEIRDLYLRGTAGLFESSEDVSREEFRAFVHPVVRTGLVDAMNWVPAVPLTLAPAVEERERAGGATWFRVFPDADAAKAEGRDFVYPILYREPLAGNPSAVGFDLGSEALRRMTLEEAASTSLPTASEAVELIGDKSPQIAILCAHPVLSGAAASRQASRAVRGFVVAVVRMGAVIDRAATFRGGDTEPVLAELFQLGSGGLPILLASAASTNDRPAARIADGARPGTVFPIFFLGKTYGVVLRPGPGFDAAYPRRAGWLSIVAGLLVTAASSGFTGFVTNRRRRLERSVQDRTSRLASIIRGTRAGTWEWNVETGDVRVNDRWAEIAGYTQADLAPITIATWRALCHPDDLERSDELLRAHLAGEIEYYDCECRMRHKAGHWVWIQDRGAVVEWRPDGKPRLMSGTHTDITARKLAEEAFQRSEEKLRLAVEAASDGLWDWDIQTGVVDWSARSYTMLGFVPQELPLTFENWKDLVHPDDRLRVLAEIERQLHARGQLAIEFRYRCKDGHWLWVLSRGRVVGTDGEGFPARMIGTHTDIDRRRRAEEEAIRARQEAEMASNAKSEFLANTSHELRTPLNSIIGFSSALVSGVFGPIGNAKHREYLGDIESSGRHLLALINDILDLSAVEAGKLDIREEEFAIAPACDAVIRLVRLRAEQGRITLRSTMPEDLPRLRADERRFKQVLLNLLTNAIKFTPAMGRVELSAKIEPDGALSMVVSDSGIGMDAEGIRRAMMEFMRVDSSLSRKHEGAGLGLPLSRRLMEMHGGTLTLASVPGAGTVATATFPAGRVLAGEKSLADPAV